MTRENVVQLLVGIVALLMLRFIYTNMSDKIFWTVLFVLDLCGAITTDSKPVRLLSIIAVICCVIKLTTL